MKKCLLIIVLFCLLLRNSNADYIIPFNIINLANNQTLIEEDFLSNIFSRRLCSNFLIGSNNEIMKAIINMSQIGFYIYDDAYNYKYSSSYKRTKDIKSFYHKSYEKGHHANDTICLIEYEPKRNLNDLDLKKCDNFYNVNFQHLKSEKIPNIIKYYSQHGIIGLGMHSNQDEYQVFTFIKSLKNTDKINSHIFSFNFVNNQENANTQGYLYIGQEEEDENIGRKHKVISTPNSGQIFWNLKFQKIDTAIYNKTNSSIFENYKEFDVKLAEIIVDLPYIIGIKQYKLYIDAIFFRDLVNKNICSLKKIKLDESYSTYVCDNTSELFKQKFENEFPTLKFHHVDLNKTFILHQHDLFTYNFLNKSDKNIYFLIFFSDKNGKYNPYNPAKSDIQRWKLGLPFFKKYKLSFNADSREIGYYEIFYKDNTNYNKNNINEENIIDKEKPINGSKDSYLLLEIGGIILLLLIFFFLGFLFHKNIIRLPRKKKANELDDEYEYYINTNQLDNKKASLNNYEVHSF